MYLLDDTPENRKLIDQYIDVWKYTDGRIEFRANAMCCPADSMTGWQKSIRAQSSSTRA
jgi:hypothetical protein